MWPKAIASSTLPAMWFLGFHLKVEEQEVAVGDLGLLDENTAKWK